MEKLGRVLFWLFLFILIWGCEGKKSPNGPEIPDPIVLTATKPAAELALPQNLEIALSDLLGKELPAGEVSVNYYYADADTAWQLNHYQGPSNIIKFYGPAFPGDSDANGVVDFDDFGRFATVFGLKSGQVGFDRLFDYNADGRIEWGDFWVFADWFGSVATAAGVVAAKPIVLPDSPPESLGRMTHEDLVTAWPGLMRSAKTAIVVDRQYQFRIKSLERAFADTTIKVTGEIFGNRRFAWTVNAAPRVLTLADSNFSAEIGDTVRVVMSRYFETDDQLRFEIRETVLPWIVANDSILLVPPVSPGTTVISFRATDTANQSVGYRLTIETLPAPAPPDTTLPTGSLRFENNMVFITAADAEDSVYVVLEANDQTLLAGWFASLDESIPLALPEFSTTTISFWISDKATNGPALYQTMVQVGDITPPTMRVQTEWVGDRKNQLALNVAFSDNQGLADYRVATGTLDYSSNGQGRGSINFSPSDANFPIVSSVTVREIKLHACDTVGNCAETSVFVDQPVSPEPPPPPPPPPPVPNINDARVNGAAPGATVQVQFGTTLSCTAPVSGTWTLGSQSADGTSASFTAVSGTLTLTMNGNTTTWNIAALGGAP